jgi:hypothetical protein
MTKLKGNLVPSASVDSIDEAIHEIRGRRVMLDRDLADLYGVTTKNLNKAVKRNRDRFPADFMFQLSEEEYAVLRFQTGTLKRGQHAKYLPYAFTQEGVSMLSGVLRSSRAVEVNVAIMRAFVRLRVLVSGSKELAEKLSELESRLTRHDYDIASLLETIRRLMNPPRRRTKRIGYI